MSLQKNVVIQSESFKRLIKYAIGLFLKLRDLRVSWSDGYCCVGSDRVRPVLVYVATTCAAQGPSWVGWQIFCRGSHVCSPETAGQLLEVLLSNRSPAGWLAEPASGPFQSARSGLELDQDAKHAHVISCPKSDFMHKLEGMVDWEKTTCRNPPRLHADVWNTCRPWEEQPSKTWPNDFYAMFSTTGYLTRTWV